MSIFDLLIVVSIVAESFPISSSGHLVLLEKYLQRFGYFFEPLNDVINHIAALSPVIILPLFFYKEWMVFWQALVSGNYGILIQLLGCGFCAELITVLWYLFFAHIGTQFFHLYAGFFITGCLLFSLRFAPVVTADCPIKIRNFLVLGMVQGCALLPGISRLGSTFVVGRWLGMNNQQAFFISSLLQWPISFAGFFKGLSMISHEQMVQLLNPITLCIMLVSIISAYGGLWMLNILISNNYISCFSWYLFFIGIVAYFIKA